MNSFRFFSVKQASSHLIVLHDTASTQTRSRSTVFTKDAVYDDQSVISEREITWTDLAKAIGDYLLQSIGGYMSMDMFIKSVYAYLTLISSGSARNYGLSLLCFRTSSTWLIGQVNGE
ncbi:hypothetical protein Rs2_15773 [Raphanus sativus]|nr:hypothetical protein Rs2_15773 [Raphanus sativus]